MLDSRLDFKKLNEVYQAYIQFNGNIKKAAKFLKMKKEEFEALADKAKKAFNQTKEVIELTFDIETSMMLAGVFGLYDQNIQFDNVIQDWFIISAQWAINDGKVESISVLDGKDGEEFIKKYQDIADRARKALQSNNIIEGIEEAKNILQEYHNLKIDDALVVKKLHSLLMEADFVSYHNGDKFDMKKFNARAVHHGLDPIPEKKSFDSLKECRKKFKFTSNKLGDLCKILNIKHQKGSTKIKNAWIKATLGDSPSIKDIEKYGRKDVSPVRDIKKKILPYSKPAKQRLTHNSVFSCPKCESFNLASDGTKQLVSGLVTRFKCRDCHKHCNSNTATHHPRKK